MTLTPLLPLMYEPLVRTALLEDLGRAGDITADAIVPADRNASLVLRARQPGVVAGLDIARCAFQLVNPAIRLTAERPDGSVVAPGDVIATIEGPARGLLTGERTALNFLCHLSGVATATASLVTGSAGHQGAHRLHPQDHARTPRAGKIRGPRRRRQQSPFWPRRRHSDQGQPHRAGRRCQNRDRARESACRPPRQDRDRGRHAGPA